MRLKIQHYFLGSVSLVIAIAFSFFNSSQEARYQARDNNAFAPNGIAGYAEYINSMRANEITGLVTQADIQKATDEINALPTNKTNSLTWETKGPDNYGGRTRALLIDKDNSSHLYAGSVGGGIFKSINFPLGKGLSLRTFNISFAAAFGDLRFPCLCKFLNLRAIADSFTSEFLIVFCIPVSIAPGLIAIE